MKVVDPGPCLPRDSAVEERAADWLVRSHGHLSSDERAELQRWLAADPRHQAAYTELGETWRALNEARASGRAEELGRELETRRLRRTARRRSLALAGLGLAAAAALVFSLVPLRPPTPAPTIATVAVSPDRQVLPDGSTVELNAGASIAVDFTAAKRGVRLLSGEALFEVRKEAARPFVVTAGGVEVRAVGTAFSVRRDEGQVGVLVTEGRVAVERAAPSETISSAAASRPAPLAFVNAGARVVLPVDLPAGTALEINPTTPQEVAAALAWRGRRVEFSGTPVAEAVEFFNRQNRLQLAVADKTLAQHQLSGIFSANDPEGFARLLETGMGAAAERTGDTITLRRK